MTPAEELELLELEDEDLKLEQEQRQRATKPAGPASHGAEEANEPAGPEEPEGEGLMTKVGGALKSAGQKWAQGSEDFLTTASKFGTLGLDDELARGAARLGTTVQRQMDSDDATLSGGGESLADSWRASAELGDEAKAERRGDTDMASERSPIMSGMGAVAGMGMTAPTSALGQIAAGAAGGVGMSDADTEEEALGAGALGAGIGALFPAGAAVASKVSPLIKKGAANAGSLLRKAAPAAAERTAGALEGLVNAAEGANPLGRAGMALATGGSSEAGIAGAKGAANLLRRATAKKPTESLVPELGADDLQGLLANLKAPPAAAAPIAEAVAPAAENAATRAITRVSPAADDVVIPQAESVLRPRAPSAGPPAAATGPAGEVLTDLRKSTLGRNPTGDEIRKAVEAVALKNKTADVATIVNETGLSSRQVSESLTPMLRTFKFREAIGKNAAPAAAEAVEAAPMALSEGADAPLIRKAQQTAQSPVDNVSGRASKQVQAIGQQEGWSRAYQALPAEQRGAYIQQLKQESGLPDDTIRRRLKLTKAEWSRLSFSRAGAREPSTPEGRVRAL